MTEDDARTKWCPFARVPDGGGVTGALTASNRHAGQKAGGDGKPRILRGNAMCIGSECMAWRWIPPAESPLFAAAAEERARTHGYLHQGKAHVRDVAYRNPPKGVDYDRHDGHCGLAGPAR